MNHILECRISRSDFLGVIWNDAVNVEAIRIMVIVTPCDQVEGVTAKG